MHIYYKVKITSQSCHIGFLQDPTMSSKSPSILLFLLLLLTVAVAVTTARTTSLCSSSPVSPGSCSIRCFRADPVCGVNNVTYWCGCPEARCAGVRVVKLGPCET
ncbi:hypothetical protein Hanom_Chr08g00717071 [Helianthus anomalus]